MLYYPPHLRHVATLPREIKNSNFLQMWKKTQTNCILIASNFVIHPQILIFSLFEITSLSPILIANKIVHVTVLLLVYFCHQLWHRKFVWADDTAAFVNNQHGIQQRGQDFDKKKIRIWTNEVDTRNSCEKLDKACGVNKLLKKLQDTGTVDRPLNEKKTAMPS